MIDLFPLDKNIRKYFNSSVPDEEFVSLTYENVSLWISSDLWNYVEKIY